jgi:hypothetical protein
VFRIQFERGLEGGGSRIQLTFEQMGAAEVIVEVRRVSDSLRSLRQTGDRFGIVLLSKAAMPRRSALCPESEPQPDASRRSRRTRRKSEGES